MEPEGSLPCSQELVSVVVGVTATEQRHEAVYGHICIWAVCEGIFRRRWNIKKKKKRLRELRL
jgi:hypothetical protein